MRLSSWKDNEVKSIARTVLKAFRLSCKPCILDCFIVDCHVLLSTIFPFVSVAFYSLVVLVDANAFLFVHHFP